MKKDKDMPLPAAEQPQTEKTSLNREYDIDDILLEIDTRKAQESGGTEPPMSINLDELLAEVGALGRSAHSAGKAADTIPLETPLAAQEKEAPAPDKNAPTMEFEPQEKRRQKKGSGMGTDTSQAESSLPDCGDAVRSSESDTQQDGQVPYILRKAEHRTEENVLSALEYLRQVSFEDDGKFISPETIARKPFWKKNKKKEKPEPAASDMPKPADEPTIPSPQPSERTGKDAPVPDESDTALPLQKAEEAQPPLPTDITEPPTPVQQPLDEADAIADEILHSASFGRPHVPQGDFESLFEAAAEEAELEAPPPRALPPLLVEDRFGDTGAPPSEGDGEQKKFELHIDYSSLDEEQVLPGGGSEEEENVSLESRPQNRRKERRIGGFKLTGDESPLDGQEAQEENEPEAVQEEIDDYNAPEDRESVLTDLKSLRFQMSVRMIVVFALLLLSGGYILLQGIGASMPEVLSRVASPATYIAIHLGIGLACMGVCYTVFLNGFGNLLRLKADSDSACALCMLGAVLQCVTLLFGPEYLVLSKIPLLMPAAILCMLFNTIGKMQLVRRTYMNFKPVSSPKKQDKYGMVLIEDLELAKDLTRGAVDDIPFTVCSAKIGFIKNFIKNSYSYDDSDNLCRISVPLCLGLGLLISAGTLLTGGSAYSAMTCFAIFMAMAAPLSLVTSVNAPLLSAARLMLKRGGAILGGRAIELFGDANSLVVDAAQIFPQESIELSGLKTYHGARIDDAIIDIASLVRRAGSVLSPVFMKILGGDEGYLREITSFQYEGGKGIVAWNGGTRMLLGNRELMESYGIDVPDRQAESRYEKEKKIMLYFARQGELCAAFVIALKEHEPVGDMLALLESRRICTVVRTVDCFVSISRISRVYQIGSDYLEIASPKASQELEKYVCDKDEMDACVMHNGTLDSYASAICCVRALRKMSTAARILQTASILLGFILAAVFSFLTGGFRITLGFLMLYQLGTAFVVYFFQRFIRMA